MLSRRLSREDLALILEVDMFDRADIDRGDSLLSKVNCIPDTETRF
jgi:hypothetical protein